MNSITGLPILLQQFFLSTSLLYSQNSASSKNKNALFLDPLHSVNISENVAQMCDRKSANFKSTYKKE